MDEPKQIKLDGTFGAGSLTEVKVYTRIPDSSQMREETYTIPYLFLDTNRIAFMHAVGLIAGFAIVSEQKSTQLKDLGL